MSRTRIQFTERAHGDFSDVDAPPHPGGDIPPRPWTWLRQVHGAAVVVVTSPGEHCGVEADAAVTAVPGCALVVRTADCAPVMLAGDGAVGIAHAGWKGVRAGVVEATAQAMRDLGVEPHSATIGPCIQPVHYEFGADELDHLAAHLGDSIRSTTSWGAPALDIPAAVRAAAERAGIDRVSGGELDTANENRFFSYRLRGEIQRMATFAWMS
jgi:YfiH family protein